MKNYKLHTLTELILFSGCHNYGNYINDKILADPLIFNFSVIEEDKVTLDIKSVNATKDTLSGSIEFTIEQMEHLHSWLGLVLKYKTEIPETSKASDKIFKPVTERLQEVSVSNDIYALLSGKSKYISEDQWTEPPFYNMREINEKAFLLLKGAGKGKWIKMLEYFPELR